MSAAAPLAVGLIGCGNISETYLANAGLFADAFRIVAVADARPEAAQSAGQRHAIAVTSPEALLADPAIEAVLNLTVPAAHVPVGLAAIEAGKHVYLEKPLGTSIEEAERLIAAAGKRGLRVGVAPDTVLGAAHQTARRLIEAGAIGRIVGGSAAVLDRGMEAWHPDPAFFFAPGGGPVFDMGPYYLASLIGLLGPVQAVAAFGTVGIAERRVGSGPKAGSAIPVSVPTSVNALLRFAGGADIVFSASWDVWSHRRSHIELYGTEGTLVLPDPNWFGGPVLLGRPDGSWTDASDAAAPWGAANRRLGDGTQVADYRGLGLADMARALRAGAPHRADAGIGLAVVDAMERIAAAAGRSAGLAA